MGPFKLGLHTFIRLMGYLSFSIMFINLQNGYLYKAFIGIGPPLLFNGFILLYFNCCLTFYVKLWGWFSFSANSAFLVTPSRPHSSNAQTIKRIPGLLFNDCKIHMLSTYSNTLNPAYSIKF